jgi:ATP-binding cassette subfamily B protein
VQDAITLVTLAAALALYVPWLLVLLLVAVLPSLLGETHFASLGYSLLYSWTPERRQLDYLRYIGASDISAKELKLFGLSDFLVDRYYRLSRDFYEANKRLAVRRSLVSTLLAGLGTLGYYGAYAIIIYLTVTGYRSPAGLFTIGVLTFLAGSFRQSRDLIQRVLLSLSQVYEQSLYLDDLFSFLALEPRIRRDPGGRQVLAPIRTGFVFENVGFRYPGSDSWAVRGLDFSLAPGERIALVGENGAGKTTLVKLLARLYDPTEGRILLDGVDLREYDVESLRRNVGVIFQDFVRYDFVLRENIAVGNIAAREDEPRIETAAQRSLADSVAARLAGRERGGAVGGRVAEGGPGPGLHARRPAPHPRRADRRARRASRVRGLPALLRADGGADGGAHLPPVQHGADGRPDPGAPRRETGGARNARGAGGAGRAVRGAVPPAGGGVPLTRAPGTFGSRPVVSFAGRCT